MNPQGHEALQQALGWNFIIEPSPAPGQDVRFVHFEVHPGSVPEPNSAAYAWHVTRALNRLTGAGLMEYHNEHDSASVDMPSFRVLDIDKGIVHLEDINSANY